MTVLDASHLLDKALPADWAPVIEALAEVKRLKKSKAAPKSERSAEANLLYQKVLTTLASIEEPIPANLKHTRPEFKRWFAEAVLLWISLAKTGSDPLLDSVGADSLEKFPIDLPFDEQTAARVALATKEAFGFDHAEFDDLQQHVQHLTANLELKRKLAVALTDYARKNDWLTPRGRVSFMHAFYPDVPWRAGDVDVAITAANIFFFVPRRGQKLEVDDWDLRSADEQQQIAEFFEELDRANIAETERFPAFGLCRPDELDPDMLGALAEATGTRVEVAAKTLETMFSFIPTRLRSQYLVHDTWGHTWQEAVSEFEWEYALLPQAGKSLTPSCGNKFLPEGDDAPSYLDAFEIVQKAGQTQVELNEQLFWQVLETDLTGRLRVGISMVISEVFADFMEAKFSRSKWDRRLPTSSLIPVESLKLDLTIEDLTRQVRRTTGPIYEFATDPNAQQLFAEALRTQGRNYHGVAKATAKAAKLVRDRIRDQLDLELEVVNVEGGIRSTILIRTLLQMVLVMAACERALGWTAPEGVELWMSPERSPDLFVIASTHFYEQDRFQNFWHLDQVARTEFEPACLALKSALIND